MELRSATITSTVNGATRSERVELPYNWDRRQAGRPGDARFELVLPLDIAPTVPWGIYLPRVGNTFEVWVNGALAQASGDLNQVNTADYAKAPVFVAVPAELLQVGDNTISVRIHADSGRRAGLAPLAVGPAAVVRGARYFAGAFAWRVTGSVLFCAFSLVAGSIALALWLTQVDSSAAGGRGREAMYLWAALAEFCWALRLADNVIAQPPLDWPAWSTLMSASFSAWAVSTILFCQHIAGWHRSVVFRRFGWLLVGVFAVPVGVSWFAVSGAQPQWMTVWIAVEIAVLLGYAIAFLASTFRRPNAARILVSMAVAVTLAVGTRDWYVIRVSDAYGEFSYLRYASVAFGLALLSILVVRFRTASTQARNLLDTLASQLALREAELAQTYRQIELAAGEQARAQERERILADMHDGVGTHLSAAIRQLQSGRARHEDLLGTLRDSLDQLKLSLDLTRLPSGDVGALLAALRYRLENRMTALGLSFNWAVDELPLWPGLDDRAMGLLQYFLFEAISNVLQHARARVLRVEAAQHGVVLRLALIDDGVGFDATQPPRALAERAQSLGAKLAVESRPGRTVVQLEL